MRIAYAKLGRSIPLNIEDASNVGGDSEVIRLLDRLVAEGHEVHVVSRTVKGSRRTDGSVVDHWSPGGAFHGLGVINPQGAKPTDPNVEEYRRDLNSRVDRLPDFDAWIIWIGIHGTSSWFIPSVDRPGDTVTPQVQQINYVLPVSWSLNRKKPKTVIWLCPDPRNLLKDRTIYEHGRPMKTILGQYDYAREMKSWNEETQVLSTMQTKYKYGAVEMLAIPAPDDQQWHDRFVGPVPEHLFGIMVNEGRPDGTYNRLKLVQEWLSQVEDGYEIYGDWSEKAQNILRRKICKVEYNEVTETLQRWKATITFPASSTGWATAKPWECFIAGTVCFAHPKYDDLGFIYSREHMPGRLYDFLRLKSPRDFVEKLEKLRDDYFWRNIVRDQHDYVKRMWKIQDGGYRFIREQLNGND